MSWPGGFLRAGIWVAVASLFGATTATLAQPASGTLDIRTEAGVEVLWEGVALGAVPADGTMTVEQIPPGIHHLVLRRPGAPDMETQVEVESGRNTLSLSMALSVPLPTAPPTVPVREPSPPSRSVPAPPAVESRVNVPENSEPAAVGPAIAQPTKEPKFAPPREPVEVAAARMARPDEGADIDERAGSPVGESSSGSMPSLPFLLAAIVGVAAVGLLFRRKPSGTRKHPTQETANAAGGFVTEQPATVQGDSAEFLASLKRQEDRIETPGSEAAVIEGEVIEVWEEDDR